MKIFVAGTRGIPDIPGGVETHCQHLYPLIAAKGHHVIVGQRSAYMDNQMDEWKGVALKRLFSPKKKSIEAIVHTIISVLTARVYGVDILHVHAVGPAIVIPLARLLGLKVVFTNHGPDYDRDKWGWLAKRVLLLGEYLGCKYSHEIIVISNEIKSIMMRRCSRDSTLIYNGVTIPEKITDTSYIRSLGLERNKYIIAVARFVPEKGLHDLVKAYQKINLDYKLVLVGDADHEDQYSRELKEGVRDDSRIVLTGYITGESLKQIYTHARLFVLPSYHEGLPISLLEAMSYGIQPLVSDIPANIEVGLDKQSYFHCKDVGNLHARLIELLSRGYSEADRQNLIGIVKSRYNWNDIAEKTISVYKRVLDRA